MEWLFGELLYVRISRGNPALRGTGAGRLRAGRRAWSTVWAPCELPLAPIIVVSKPFLPWFNTSRLMGMTWNSWAIAPAACVITRMLRTWCRAPLLMARRTEAF